MKAQVTTVKIAIVDDLSTEAQQLQDMLKNELSANHIHIRALDLYSSAEALLAVWQPEQYDLILLDIFMGGITGVEAAHMLRERDERVRLVFCTTSNEFASESYSVGASYYLHKPYSREDIQRMVMRVRPADYELTRAVTLPDGHKLLPRSLLYSEYANHVITLYCKYGRTIQTRLSQGALETLLSEDPEIISCSKGLLVNLHEVAALEEDTLLLSDGTRLPVSRRRAKEVQQLYHNFLFRKLRKEMLST